MIPRNRALSAAFALISLTNVVVTQNKDKDNPRDDKQQPQWPFAGGTNSKQSGVFDATKAKTGSPSFSFFGTGSTSTTTSSSTPSTTSRPNWQDKDLSGEFTTRAEQFLSGEVPTDSAAFDGAEKRQTTKASGALNRQGVESYEEADEETDEDDAQNGDAWTRNGGGRGDAAFSATTHSFRAHSTDLKTDKANALHENNASNVASVLNGLNATATTPFASSISSDARFPAANDRLGDATTFRTEDATRANASDISLSRLNPTGVISNLFHAPTHNTITLGHSGNRVIPSNDSSSTTPSAVINNGDDSRNLLLLATHPSASLNESSNSSLLPVPPTFPPGEHNATIAASNASAFANDTLIGGSKAVSPNDIVILTTSPTTNALPTPQNFIPDDETADSNGMTNKPNNSSETNSTLSKTEAFWPSNPFVSGAVPTPPTFMPIATNSSVGAGANESSGAADQTISFPNTTHSRPPTWPLNATFEIGNSSISNATSFSGVNATVVILRPLNDTSLTNQPGTLDSASTAAPNSGRNVSLTQTSVGINVPLLATLTTPSLDSVGEASDEEGTTPVRNRTSASDGAQSTKWPATEDRSPFVNTTHNVTLNTSSTSSSAVVDTGLQSTIAITQSPTSNNTFTRLPAAHVALAYSIKLAQWNWDDALADKQSLAFRSLLRQLNYGLTQLFQAAFADNFVSQELQNFEKGSVIAKGVLLVRNSDNKDLLLNQATEELRHRQNTVNDESNRPMFKLDPKSFTFNSANAEPNPYQAKPPDSQSAGLPTWGAAIIAAVAVFAVIAVGIGCFISRRNRLARQMRRRDDDYAADAPAQINGKAYRPQNGRDNYSGVNMYEMHDVRGNGAVIGGGHFNRGFHSDPQPQGPYKHAVNAADEDMTAH